MGLQTFDVKTQKFLHWLRNDANVQISEKIDLVDLRSENQGRCVIATQNISSGEVLFEIPRDSLLNVSTSSLAQISPQIREKLVTAVGHWEGLVLSILYEYKVLRERSRWWPYFEVFPDINEMNNLMYWSNDEIQFLKPSPVLTRIGRDSAKVMYQQILNLIEEFQLQELNAVTWEEFVYVASVIMAYSFDMECNDFKDLESFSDDEDNGVSSVSRDGFLKSMVPLADMLNSDTHLCNAKLMYSTSSLTMTAVSDIPAGHQVFNIYGDHPNAEILRRYGYVEWTGSKFDFGEIPLEIISSAANQCFGIPIEFVEKVIEIIRDSEKIEQLTECEPIILDYYDCYVDGQVLPESITLIQVLVTAAQIPHIDTFDYENLEGCLQRITKKAIQIVGNGKMTKRCLRLCEYIVNERLKDYPSHAFREMSPDHFEIHNDFLRQRMAECVLKSEVRSIQNCFQSLERNYRIMEDQKFLGNVMKRGLESKPKSQREVKRAKR